MNQAPVWWGWWGSFRQSSLAGRWSERILKKRVNRFEELPASHSQPPKSHEFVIPNPPDLALTFHLSVPFVRSSLLVTIEEGPRAHSLGADITSGVFLGSFVGRSWSLFKDPSVIRNPSKHTQTQISKHGNVYLYGVKISSQKRS